MSRSRRLSVSPPSAARSRGAPGAGDQPLSSRSEELGAWAAICSRASRKRRRVSSRSTAGRGIGAELPCAFMCVFLGGVSSTLGATRPSTPVDRGRSCPGPWSTDVAVCGFRRTSPAQVLVSRHGGDRRPRVPSLLLREGQPAATARPRLRRRGGRLRPDSGEYARMKRQGAATAWMRRLRIACVVVMAAVVVWPAAASAATLPGLPAWTGTTPWWTNYQHWLETIGWKLPGSGVPVPPKPTPTPTPTPPARDSDAHPDAAPAGGGGTPAKGASFSGNFTGSAGTRAYRGYVPSTYAAGQALPLVVVLHGCTESAQVMAVADALHRAGRGATLHRRLPGAAVVGEPAEAAGTSSRTRTCIAGRASRR